jgi:hypothetical protein
VLEDSSVGEPGSEDTSSSTEEDDRVGIRLKPVLCELGVSARHYMFRK